ncbi:MAG: hypothetical protein PHR60_00255 [Eubacteriales bacterium]|nr:hypothetical protein [Eubacteriales bacterium]MDD4582608.1 hypothetical protein [Eubacteriales bacterium]
MEKGINFNGNPMKVAQISPEALESINSCQAKIKRENGNDVILVAYEKLG